MFHILYWCYTVIKISMSLQTKPVLFFLLFCTSFAFVFRLIFLDFHFLCMHFSCFVSAPSNQHAKFAFCMGLGPIPACTG